MPKVIQYQCDIPGCTAVRGESNHWFLAEFQKDSESAHATLLISRFTELALYDAEANGQNHKIICGEDHVHTFVSMHLNELFPKKEIEGL